MSKKNITPELSAIDTSFSETVDMTVDKETIGTTPVYATEAEKIEAFKRRKNEASKKMLARKAEAMSKLIALALKAGNEEEQAAAKYLMPRPVGPKVPKNEVLDYITTNGPQSEDQIWMKFKFGRYEMKKVLKANSSIQFIDDLYQIV